MGDKEASRHAELIYQRIQPWFKRLPNTRYRLIIVNDVYDHCYNFYIEISRYRTLTRLVPLHELDDYELASLIKVVRNLYHDFHLPAELRNFNDHDKRMLNRCF
ncbi:acetyl-CoA carboxylase [Nicoliella lavandulae]|uniref:Acetyl-CoA carboxylase n=1 Tax=Nicoliella lavandulae TaxID=3082954 RepID=A0ABU8SMQ4_9LACO